MAKYNVLLSTTTPKVAATILRLTSLIYILVWPWGVGGVSVLCAGPAAVAPLRVGWLNVRSSALLDLCLRFCILDAVLMYF